MTDHDETESGRLDVPNWAATPRGRAFPNARPSMPYLSDEDSRALQIARDIDRKETDAQMSFLLGMACGGLVVMAVLPLTLWLVGALK
jgi:hypothetical protein